MRQYGIVGSTKGLDLRRHGFEALFCNFQAVGPCVVISSL